MKQLKKKLGKKRLLKFDALRRVDAPIAIQTIHKTDGLTPYNYRYIPQTDSTVPSLNGISKSVITSMYFNLKY